MIVLMLLGGLLFYRTYHGTEKRRHPFDLQKVTIIRVFAMPVLVVLYIYVLELVGYLLATVVGLAIFSVYFGVREVRIIIPVSLSIPFLLYLFFEKILKIVMPKGALFY